MKKLPNLTGLRFVLAALVIIFHIPQFCQHRNFPFYNAAAIFNKGEEAVYMFFSLSGFLIVRLLYLEKSTTNTIRLKAFFFRRILRISPLYYFVLCFGFAYYRYILPHLGFDYPNHYNLTEGILLSFTLFPNIFAVYQPGGIIEMLWSIGIEEQFYLLFAPLLCIIPSRFSILFLFLFTTIYFIVYFSNWIPFLSHYSMLFFYFSLSGLCSIICLNATIKWHKFSGFILLIFVAYLTTSVFKNNLSTVGYHLFSMFLFGLVLSVLVQQPYKILNNSWFNHLGKISYGLYMYHAIVMQLVGYLFLKYIMLLQISTLESILLFNGLVFVFTILTAHVSYTYFESYFLNLKRSNPKKVSEN